MTTLFYILGFVCVEIPDFKVQPRVLAKSSIWQEQEAKIILKYSQTVTKFVSRFCFVSKRLYQEVSCQILQLLIPPSDMLRSMFCMKFSLLSGFCLSDSDMPSYSAENAFAKSNSPSSAFQCPSACACAVKLSDNKSGFCPIVNVLVVASMPAKIEKNVFVFQPFSSF